MEFNKYKRQLIVVMLPKMVKVQNHLEFLFYSTFMQHKLLIRIFINLLSNMETAALYELYIMGYHSQKLSIIYLAIVKSNVSER